MNAASAPSPSAPWYREAFQEGYIELYGHRDLAEAARAVKFLATALELAREQRVLDLCCGPGRHLFFLGRLVNNAVGLDLSRFLLDQARAHWQAGHAVSHLAQNPDRPASPLGWMLEQTDWPVPAHEQPRLVQATMSRLPFASASFDRVVNLFTSFGYFEEEARNQAVLDEISRVLRPQGLMAIDHINRDALLANLQPRSERDLSGGRHVLETRRWDAAAQRVVKQVSLREPDGRERGWSESVRVYEPDELESMLERVGLSVLRRHGGYDGADWTSNAPRLIIIARRS